MSKTISINAGSSSLKWQLYLMPEEKVVAKGLVERIGLPNSIFTIKYGEGEKFELVQDIENHEIAVQMLMDQLIELGILASYDEITGVGHRIVHGGEYYSESVVIDDEVVEKIEECAAFAPLHNPAHVMGIRAFRKLLPGVINVAVFDTAFHANMPEFAYLYSLPMEYYDKYKVRKYGAHGTSHRYVAHRAAEVLGKPIEELKLITCHLGNGASITAVDGGRSVDTSMGFTPLAGVTMGTRSGDIDPSVVTFIMKKEGLTPDEMERILNKESGILALSGVTQDCRDMEAAAAEGNEQAALAIKIHNYLIAAQIAKCAVAMNGFDVMLFTAGIGENQKNIRKGICENLKFLGVEIDDERNDVKGEERLISSDNSKIKVYVVPTDEELMIAKQTLELIK